MDIIYEGCRLCLDPLTQCFTTIDSPRMKDQMEKVFCFTIEPIPGYSSDVCQSCFHIISEFYQYSEKVRQNQELLNENVTNCDPTVDSKIMLDRIKIEPLNNSDLPETTEGAWDPENDVSGEEGVSNFSDNELHEPPANKSQGHIGKLDDLEADEPSCHDQEILKGNEIMVDPVVDSKTTFETIKVETLSVSRLPETTEDLCHPIVEASAEEEVSNLSSDITFQSVKFEATGDSMLSEIEVSDEEEALYSSESCESSPKKSQTRQVHPRQTRRESYEEDIRVFNKHFRMICDICGMSADTFTDLSSHFRTVHKRNGYVVCCNKKLIKRNALRQHIKLHANPDLFQCEVCECKYKSRNSLNEHMAIKHPSPGPIKCDLCPQSFAKQLALTFHMKKRHVENKCPKCGNTFATRETLSRHLTKMHSDTNRPMVCDTCGKKCRDLYAFIQHRKEHKRISVERVQCGICQRWLKGYSSIRYHMNCVHSDSTLEHQCDTCFQKFPDRQAMYNHKLFMHSDPRHECEFCGKKFRMITAFREHRATHTAELTILDQRNS